MPPEKIFGMPVIGVSEVAVKATHILEPPISMEHQLESIIV